MLLFLIIIVAFFAILLYNFYGDIMKEIMKFSHELLQGEDIHVHQKHGDTAYRSHWHTYYEIILYTNCEGSCVLNGEEYDIKGNCIYFLTPRDFHKINTKYNENSRSIIISFSETFINNSAFYKLSQGPEVLYNVDQKLIWKIEEMYLHFKSKEPNFKLYLKNLLELILLDIAAGTSATVKNSEHLSEPISNVVAYLHRNPNAQLTLSRAAKTASLTPTYFSHLFHSEVGQSFKSYTNGLRISYAKRLLEETELSVLEVALECGFGSVSQFHRAFKALTHNTPTEYRKGKRVNDK